jgi:hypothetical protein
MIPKGFSEICAVAHPPIIAREYLARGAVVRFVGSQPTEMFVPNSPAATILIHDFCSRAGNGLPFRLAGSADLNAKLWACSPGWILWLQYLGTEKAQSTFGPRAERGHVWHVAGVFDGIRSLKLVMQRMEADHHVLDHGIAVEAGIYRAGELPFDQVSAAARELAPADLQADRRRTSDDRPELARSAVKRLGRVAQTDDLSDEVLDTPPVDRAAKPIHALLRSLLRDGAKPREFVYEKMEAAGYSRRQIIRAREAVGARARRRGVKGRQGGGVWLLELPGTVTVTRARDVTRRFREDRFPVSLESFEILDDSRPGPTIVQEQICDAGGERSA